MNIDLYTANIHRANMLREAEHARLVRTVTNHRRPLLPFKFPFRIQWSYTPKPVTPVLEDCPSPCV